MERGYLDGESWKLNSGIKRVEETDDKYIFHGVSGSEYHCKKTYYGVCSGYTVSILDTLTRKIIKEGYNVEELPTTFYFKNLPK